MSQHAAELPMSLQQSSDEPLIDRPANEGQYLRALEDRDWVRAVCAHSNKTVLSRGVGFTAGKA